MSLKRPLLTFTLAARGGNWFLFFWFNLFRIVSIVWYVFLLSTCRCLSEKLEANLVELSPFVATWWLEREVCRFEWCSLAVESAPDPGETEEGRRKTVTFSPSFTTTTAISPSTSSSSSSITLKTLQNSLTSKFFLPRTRPLILKSYFALDYLKPTFRVWTSWTSLYGFRMGFPLRKLQGLL